MNKILSMLCLGMFLIAGVETFLIIDTYCKSTPYFGDGTLRIYDIKSDDAGDDEKVDENNMSNTWVYSESAPVERKLTGEIDVKGKFRFFIRSVDLTTDRDWSDENVYQQCLRIEYTYINDGCDSLYIGDNMIKVKDKTGTQGVVQHIRQTIKPSSIKKGETCTATIYVGLPHASENARIYLEDETIKLKPTKECSVFIQSDLSRNTISE